MSCCSSCGRGCNGGWLSPAWGYFVNKGLVTGGEFETTETCWPYPFINCNHHSAGPYKDCSEYKFNTPKCENQCPNKSYPKAFEMDKHYGKSVYSVNGELNLINELNNRGPVEVAYTVYEDFMLYKNGIYQHKTGRALGGHAVSLVGYGVENNIKYWIMVNNWNKNWGENGTFRIIRGVNECGIESQAVAGEILIKKVITATSY